MFLNGAAALAGGDNYSIGARSAGMGNASVTLGDLWSINHNQAGLADIKKITAGIYYENRFSISEMGLKAVAAAFPIPGFANGVLGLSVSYFGYAAYNDSKFGLAYAKKLGDRYSVGIQLDYLQTTIGGDYGKKGAVAAETGFKAELIDNLFIGIHIFNPTRTKLFTYTIQEIPETERIPTIMRFGLSYRFSEKVIVSVETEKDIYYKPVFKAGIEYQPIDLLYLRAGISTDPVYNSFGFGINLNHFKIDFAASRHQVLGYTSQIGLSYEFNKKNVEKQD
mgnify:FL=1